MSTIGSRHLSPRPAETPPHRTGTRPYGWPAEPQTPENYRPASVNPAFTTPTGGRIPRLSNVT
jgi:hypothetical protein